MGIIGRGDISTAIIPKEGYTYFVTGVSNRLPVTEQACKEEHDKIYHTHSTMSHGDMFVYVSTLSIYYSASEYTLHKVKTEKIIKETFDNYAIVRIGNITWGDNPNTLLNNLGFKIVNKKPYTILDQYRYIIDREEFRHWLGMIPRYGKHEMNITGKRYKVKQIVQLIKDGKL